MHRSLSGADWADLHAVVLQSDDWGFAGWTGDVSDRPRTPPGLQRYAASTLERAEDVAALAAILAASRGRDGLPAVLQANHVLLAPDFGRLARDPSDVAFLTFPSYAGRWARPGLHEALLAAIADGVWHPEYHGALHCDLDRLRSRLARGVPTARAAVDSERWEFEDVASFAEYTSSPKTLRTTIPLGLEAFATCFGRPAVSTAAPGYVAPPVALRFLQQGGIRVVQGYARRPRRRLGRLAAAAGTRRSPVRRFGSLWRIERIADFEPAAGSNAAAVLQRCEAAWRRGMPAVVSTHRVNYVGWDEQIVDPGRTALVSLLKGLGHAIFLTDHEIIQIASTGQSVSARGSRVIVRNYGAARVAVRRSPEALKGIGIRAGHELSLVAEVGEHVIDESELR
jgi:hypothetical protein